MHSLHRAALSALGAAFLFDADTPFTKQLMGRGPAFASPYLLAGLLYLGSGLGLILVCLVRDKAWHASGLPISDSPRLLGAIGFGGVVIPVLLMLGLSHTGAVSASLFLKLEAALTARLA